MKRLSVAATAVVVVVMMHAWGISAMDISPVLSCIPDCNDIANGGKVVNPRNCSEFYYCVNGEPLEHPTACPDGNYFDTTTGECGASPCEDICGPGVAGCPLTCNGSLSFVADVFDCSKYYICTPDGTIEGGTCPDDRPNFDGTTCVYDASVCCAGYCEPYCDGSGFAQVPDPNDCTGYYVCDTVEGTPGDGYHFSCDPGMYFNIQISLCQSGVPDPCPTLCDAAGGGATTTTTSTTTTSSGGGGVTTTTSSSNGCVTSMTCPTDGYFAACQTCQPEYFSCASSGATGVLNSCPDGAVFNTNPDYAYCVQPSNCPFTPK